MDPLDQLRDFDNEVEKRMAAENREQESKAIEIDNDSDAKQLGDLFKKLQQESFSSAQAFKLVEMQWTRILDADEEARLCVEDDEDEDDD